MSSFRRGRNRGLNLRPVNRIKHVIDKQAGIVLNTVNGTTLAKAVDNPVLANTEECQTGCTINGIYLNVEAYASTSGALANVYLFVAKNPGNNISFPNPNVIGSSDNKRFVIHQEMKMLEQKISGNPRTIFNGVIVIPRVYRRMAPDDVIQVNLFAPGVDIFACIQCHYKEFR